MDEIFGKPNFRNEIVWHYYNKYSAGKRVFGRNYDQILFYAETGYHFNPLREKREKPRKQLLRENVDGVLKNKKGPDGKVMYRVVTDKKMDAVWRIPCVQPASKEYTGYPTQKPLKLLERIIEASSNPGDMVLDPFCGCATACVAAEKLDRQWIGIDVSEKAAELVKERINNELGLLLFDPIHRTDIPGDRGGRRSRDIKNVLYGKQEGMCGGCGHWYRIKDFEVDHIIPTNKGGANTDENLQLLCGNCNRIKGDRSQEYLISKVRSSMAG